MTIMIKLHCQLLAKITLARAELISVILGPKVLSFSSIYILILSLKLNTVSKRGAVAKAKSQVCHYQEQYDSISFNVMSTRFLIRHLLFQLKVNQAMSNTDNQTLWYICKVHFQSSLPAKLLTLTLHPVYDSIMICQPKVRGHTLLQYIRVLNFRPFGIVLTVCINIIQYLTVQYSALSIFN